MPKPKMVPTWKSESIHTRAVACKAFLYVYGLLTDAEESRVTIRIRQMAARGDFEEPAKARRKAGA